MLSRGCPVDREEFVSLVTTQQRRLLLLARSLLGNWVDAEDAVQEAMLNAYASKGELRNRAAFSAWMRAILVHECTRLRRRRLNAVGPASALEGHGLPDDYPRLLLIDLIDRLPRELAQVVALRYLEDMSQAEVAATLRIPLGTVKSRLNRGLVLLRDDLAGGESSVLSISPV